MLEDTEYGRERKDEIVLDTIKNVVRQFQQNHPGELGQNIADAVSILTHCSNIEIRAYEECYRNGFTLHVNERSFVLRPGDYAVRLDMMITCADDLAQKHGRVYDEYSDTLSPSAAQKVLEECFREAAGSDYWWAFSNVAKVLHAREVNLHPDWRAYLAQVAENPSAAPVNQGVNVPTAILWKNLVLGSPPEKSIAEALDRAGVLFMTNSPVRLGPDGKRSQLCPDFVVCYDGKWGLLEVDGKKYHPPENKAEEDVRNRLFHKHGISVIRHYQAKECTSDPDGVVKDFLEQLERFG